MAFEGEENYRQTLADAVRRDSISAMVRLVGLKGALAEIDRLTAIIAEREREINFLQTKINAASAALSE